jgi:hypothetical protein
MGRMGHEKGIFGMSHFQRNMNENKDAWDILSCPTTVPFVNKTRPRHVSHSVPQYGSTILK